MQSNTKSYLSTGKYEPRSCAGSAFLCACIVYLHSLRITIPPIWVHLHRMHCTGEIVIHFRTKSCRNWQVRAASLVVVPKLGGGPRSTPSGRPLQLSTFIPPPDTGRIQHSPKGYVYRLYWPLCSFARQEMSLHHRPYFRIIFGQRLAD